MAEALGLAASIITVLQLTNSVISVCHNYSAAAKGAPWELSQVRAELEGLRRVLQTLEPIAIQAECTNSSIGTKLPALSQLLGPTGLLQDCYKEIHHLDERLQLLTLVERIGPKRRAIVQALRWPLREAETKKALENIGRFKSTLAVAITVDQT